jgi:hypothetical protein
VTALDTETSEQAIAGEEMAQEKRPMSRRHRLLRATRRFAAFGFVGLVASCGTYVYLLNRDPAPLPPLLRDLPPVTAGGDDLFHRHALTARLNERFPPGSAEAELVQELWLEGFRPVTPRSAAERSAAYEPDPHRFTICVPAGYVTWSTDEAGRLTALYGILDPRCS